MDRPLHGGPVSPWPRRARRFARGCRVVLLTGLLALVVSGLVIAALTHLGTLAVGIALTVVVLVVWALVGIRPLTVALMIALLLVLFVAVGGGSPSVLIALSLPWCRLWGTSWRRSRGDGILSIRGSRSPIRTCSPTAG